MENFSKMIASNLKMLREKQNWSQQDLSDKMHIARPTISKWERGESEPSASQLAQLADLFNVSTEVIIGNTKKSGQNVIVIDTSIFIKTPAILEELVEKFDEIIIPDIVISELNNLKDRANNSVKQKAWLAMANILKLRDRYSNKIIVKEGKFNHNENNDVRIANVAKERAMRSFFDKVHMFSDDVLFGFLTQNEQSNLISLTPQKYDEIFVADDYEYDVIETQNFYNAVVQNNIELLKKIDRKKIDVNKVDSGTGYSPLIQAVRNKNLGIINFLLDLRKIRTEIKDKHKYKFTAVHHACQLRNLEILKTLVEKGADINIGSDGENSGNTPLMVCAWGGFYEGVSYLIDQNACVNQQDNNGFTALHKACIKGYFEIAKLLIPKTDLDIRDRKNKTADQHIDTSKQQNAPFIQIFNKRRLDRNILK
jgi:transcriptional regulator with XRE-family HTH domain